MENEKEVMELESQILDCIAQRKVQTLRQLFEEYPIIDIAEALDPSDSELISNSLSSSKKALMALILLFHSSLI